MPPSFADSTAHLLAELERIDLLIRARVASLRKVQSDDEHFRGLYISEQEIDRLLDKPLGEPQWLTTLPPARWAAIEAELVALGERNAASALRGVKDGAELRLEQLRRWFALEPLEVDTLLVCLAAELDQRYEKLYAYLQDDVTRKRPTVDLVLNLLTPTPASHRAGWRRFLPDAALCRHRLVELIDDPAQPHPTLLSRAIKADDRIVQYLLGSDAVDARLRHCAEMRAAPLPDLLLAEGLQVRLGHVLPRDADGVAPVVHLSGPAGVGKRTLAAAMCRERGLAVLVVNLERLLTEAPAALAGTLALIAREARLQRAAVLFDGLDLLRSEAQQSALAVFRDSLARAQSACFLTGESDWDSGASFCAQRYVHLALPRPDAVQRRASWQAAMAGSPADPGAVASRFKLTFGQIEAAAATARMLARLRGGPTETVGTADLFEACRVNSNRRLGTLARKIVPRYRWDDIVLPADRIAQLREICNHLKYRERVYGDWGFGNKLALGKGLMVLFAGPSGTGKTMAADVIAGELGLELYKIDLSSVISKYIGETEKNLARIFDEAETSNAILFFDEADALFGKRSEVKDSHDRYANIEVGYLLQRMEEYEGVAILATNLRKNMDEAFVRRLHFTVDLPFPDEADRHRIWQAIWPKDTPRDDDLDFASLAQRFELTGGNIRNVALEAAFLAADEGEVVRMSHLIHATQREYQKTGKLLRDHDFPECNGK
jgi:SpoVK/Ycf46/Vps4 family AAA+-type ATPase